MKLKSKMYLIAFLGLMAGTYIGYIYYDSRAPIVSVELEADLSDKLKKDSPINVVSTGAINSMRFVHRCEVMAIGEGASKSDSVAKWGCMDRSYTIGCPEMTITYRDSGGAMIELHDSKYDYSKDSVISCAKLAIKTISTVRIPTSEESKNGVSWGE